MEKWRRGSQATVKPGFLAGGARLRQKGSPEYTDMVCQAVFACIVLGPVTVSRHDTDTTKTQNGFWIQIPNKDLQPEYVSRSFR
jgi:hypothetical protein